MNIVTLLSGGQDSTTCLFWAKARWPEAAHIAVSFDYGQRHHTELASARWIAVAASVEHVIAKIDVPLGGALVDQSCVSGKRLDGLPATFVPGRNAIFLTIAAGVAAARGGPIHLVIGANAIDYSGYPDCRPEFIIQQQRALESALATTVTIHAPLIDRTKAQIVEQARHLPGCWEALAHSWTCYDPQDLDPCDICPACVIRAKGFSEAGLQDPAR